MRTSRRFPHLLVAALVAAGTVPAHGQGPGPMRVLAFTDTTSVRIEVSVSGAAELAGAPVRAVITGTADEGALWSGEIGTLAVGADGVGLLTARVDHLHPRLWSPASPHLYRLTIAVSGRARRLEETVRFGFRSFAARDGRLWLNGRPIFLRGNAINPPDRTLPDSLSENRAFAMDYIRYLKRIGVNIVRFTRHSQVWFDVCDELGMMVFQGNYGRPKGGTATSPPDGPFEESLAWYKDEVFAPLVNHPSVVVYVLANEQAAEEIPYLNKGAKEVREFLTRTYTALRAWDDTRAYIGNAGYGFGRSGDICDIHRYWGWYYNSFLSFYTLRDPSVCWRSSRAQPITLTENTGNYTGPDGRFNLVSATKQPASQLHWTGHAPESEQAARALTHQAFVAKQAIEISRRIRERNPYVAGLLPFTILFRNWWGIGSFSEMGPKPVAEQYAVSYQPVLLSWELWTPQVYAGSTIRPVAHVVNDSDTGEALRGLSLQYSLTAADGRVILTGERSVADVPYYAARSLPLALELPSTLPTGSYTLAGRLLRGADTVSHNETTLFVAGRTFAGSVGRLARRVVLHDPSGDTERALRRLRVPFRSVATLEGLDPERHLLVIGAAAWDDALERDRVRLEAFVAAGGRVLCLRQTPERFDPSWLPAAVRLQTEPLDHPLVYPGGRPNRNGIAINPERPDHPVFSGIDRDRLFLWSDYTGWNESRPGFPAVYPVTQGFVLTDRADLAHTAILADYGHGLEGVALAEMFDGTGSVLLSGFDLVARVGLDPVADRMLLNLIRYQGSAGPHHAAPFIDSTIVWGDYASERGLVIGIYDGLLLNTVPLVPEGLRATYPLRIDDEGFHFAGGSGGWNSKPAIQYVGKGRRPFGPYEFSLGGSVRLPKDHAPEGEGTVWVRTPAERTTMVTTVWNPVAEPLELEIEVDGVKQRERIPPRATINLETALRRSAQARAITYRGDRRLVLLETAFR